MERSGEKNRLVTVNGKLIVKEGKTDDEDDHHLFKLFFFLQLTTTMIGKIIHKRLEVCFGFSFFRILLDERLRRKRPFFPRLRKSREVQLDAGHNSDGEKPH